MDVMFGWISYMNPVTFFQNLIEWVRQVAEVEDGDNVKPDVIPIEMLNETEGQNILVMSVLLRIIYIFASPSETSNWLNPVEWVFISPDIYVVLHYFNYRYNLGIPELP